MLKYLDIGNLYSARHLNVELLLFPSPRRLIFEISAGHGTGCDRQVLQHIIIDAPALLVFLGLSLPYFIYNMHWRYILLFNNSLPSR